MGIQKFKLKTANSVITKDNSSLSSMATDQLFDLFTLDETGNGSQPEGANGGGGVKALLEAMPELWDESQYASEYNMDTYGGP